MDETLHEAATAVLTVWGLEPFGEQFVADGESLALLALLCNQAAKLAEARGDHGTAERLYSFKPVLLRAALEFPSLDWWAAPHAWGRTTTVLFITVSPPVGQLAFHIADDEPLLADLLANAPAAEGRRWDGLPKQQRAGRARPPVARGARSWATARRFALIVASTIPSQLQEQVPSGRAA